MKWSRLTSSLLLTSFVLVFILSLFRYCLFSFSSFSFSWSLSFSVSLSSSFSFSVRDWISSMNNKHCFRIHRLIWHNRLYLHAFKLRELSSRWVFERSFSCSNLLHFRINMRIRLHLHLHRWSSIFRIEKTIAWSYDLRILYDEKRINWKNISVEFISYMM
jgi:predicted nucleotidyltransferase component of viral defense system